MDGLKLMGKKFSELVQESGTLRLVQLQDHCSVFQAEVANRRQLQLYCCLVQRSLERCTLLALRSLAVCLRLVKACLMALGYFVKRLVSVICHNGIAGKCQAAKLARKSNLTPISLDWKQVGTLLSSWALALSSTNGGQALVRLRILFFPK